MVELPICEAKSCRLAVRFSPAATEPSVQVTLAPFEEQVPPITVPLWKATPAGRVTRSSAACAANVPPECALNSTVNAVASSAVMVADGPVTARSAYDAGTTQRPRAAAITGAMVARLHAEKVPLPFTVGDMR